MEEQGCCKTGKPHKAHRDFGRLHKEKSLQKKIDLLPTLDTPHKAPCILNPDHTLTVYWSENNPICYCKCAMIKAVKSSDKPASLTYCACCAGHTRHHLQNSLGVSLKLKEVVSPVLHSQGKQRCELLFDIL